jgi:hypothetical protein
MDRKKFIFAIVDLRIDLVCEEPSRQLIDFLKNYREIINPNIPKDREKIKENISYLKTSIFDVYYYSARNAMMAAALHMYNLYGEKGIFNMSLHCDKSLSNDVELTIIPHIRNKPTKLFGSIFIIYCQKMEDDNFNFLLNQEMNYE